MKLAVGVIVALAALQYVSCGDSSQSEEYIGFFDEIRKSLKESKKIQEAVTALESVCPGVGEKFEDAVKEVETCANLIDESQETECSIIKNNAERCLKPLTKVFEECLPSRSKEIPTMFVKMVVASVNHICKSDGEHIFELANSCAKEVNTKTKRCLRIIDSKAQQYKRKTSVPSAEDICEMLESLRPCYQSHINAACGHHITRESHLQMFDAAISVCKNYENNEIEWVE